MKVNVLSASPHHSEDERSQGFYESKGDAGWWNGPQCISDGELLKYDCYQRLFVGSQKAINSGSLELEIPFLLDMGIKCVLSRWHLTVMLRKHVKCGLGATRTELYWIVACVVNSICSCVFIKWACPWYSNIHLKKCTWRCVDKPCVRGTELCL